MTTEKVNIDKEPARHTLKDQLVMTELYAESCPQKCGCKLEVVMKEILGILEEIA